MLQEAKELQQSAVDELIAVTSKKDEIVFKAPTGSGKTYMMAEMMESLLSEDDDLVFLVSSLSKGDLAAQNYEAFKEYKEKGLFPHLDPYLINTEAASEERICIPETHNVYVLPRDLYKKNGKLMQGPMDAFLRNITTGDLTSGIGKGKRIYLIKDECHQATKNLDTISNTYFDKTYNFSATPNLSRGQVIDVEIDDTSAIEAKLIKKVVWGDEETTLEGALKLYNKNIKPEYEDKLGIVPCLIIQISNKDQANEEWENIIKPALEKYDMQWMYIVDKEKDCKTNHRDFINKPTSLWKKYAKKDSSTVEVIIFKLAVSEGWDIRRACMLYQIRSTQSKQLDEQVLGRIRRNPILLDFEKYPPEAQELATTAWAWGIKPKIKQDVINVEVKSSAVIDDLRIKTTFLKDLKSDPNFDVAKIIANSKKQVTSPSIFELYRRFNNANNDVQAIGRSYINTTQDWFAFTNNISNISVAYNKQICDYNKSMSLQKDEYGNPTFTSVPNNSFYFDSEDFVPGLNCLWKRKDFGNDYAFDSEAERMFAELISRFASKVVSVSSDLSEEILLWGKNYLFGSSIKYQYYMDGIRDSYPDFILQDKYGRVHIFEVKSVNEKATSPIDATKYKKKIQELKKCYLQASILTEHIFYLPILDGRTWKITRLEKGTEDTISAIALEEYLLKDPSS